MIKMNDKLFAIVGEKGIVFTGMEKITRDIWYYMITGNFKLEFKGEMMLVEIIGEHIFPVPERQK